MTENAKKERFPLSYKILLGLVLGFVIGSLAKIFYADQETLTYLSTEIFSPIGSIFLRLIFMTVLPLIASAILLGVYELGDIRKVGSVGIYSLIFTLIFATMSVIIGLTLVNWIEPGKLLGEVEKANLVAQYSKDVISAPTTGGESTSILKSIVQILPNNPLFEATYAFDANHSGGMLSFMFACLIFGVALASISKDKAQHLEKILQAVFELSMKVISFAMRIAPVCVFCLGFALGAKMGFAILASLGAYIGVVLLGCLIHLFGTYGITLALVAKRNPITFFKQTKEVMVTAFSTSSSNATLPTALRSAEVDLKLSPRVSRFVLTVGASANQNGTALYEGVTVLFLAQVFGVELSLAQQVTVAFLCILAGIGTAGVPGGSLPLLMGVLIAVNVPPESVAIILGVDRFLDMCRTTLNVSGDLAIATAVDRLAEKTG